MEVRIRVRHRADSSYEIDQYHQKVLEAFSSIDNFLSGDVGDIELERADLCAAGDLTPLLSDGIKGAVSYVFRDDNYLSDKAMYDDFLTLDVDTEKVDYKEFILKKFPQLIAAMNAYRATAILDEDLDLDDYDEIVEQAEKTGKDIDGRDTVYRINSINYFDRKLCQRAFGLSPEQAIDRLQGKVEAVKLLNDGILLICNSQLLERNELEKIDSGVRPLLN